MTKNENTDRKELIGLLMNISFGYVLPHVEKRLDGGISVSDEAPEELFAEPHDAQEFSHSGWFDGEVAVSKDDPHSA